MKKNNMTFRQRVMTALHGDIPDITPFTIYEQKIPRCEYERDLRNRGLCLVKRVVSYNIHHPNVKVQSVNYTGDDGRQLTRNTYSTPCGDLTKLVQPAGFTSWTHERVFKSPEDYKAILFLIKDSVVEQNYGAVAGLQEKLGEDYVVRDNMPLEPLQALISEYMGVDMFCIEWMDNRDEVLKLYEALLEVARKVYPIVAEGPLEFANYGGNVIPNVIGVDNFIKYYASCYNEAAEIMHKNGKLIGTHLDADNTLIMDAVAKTDLDYIEAYDAGMSPPVREARRKWPGKALWLNWPSAWHLEPVEEVYKKSLGLLEEAAPRDGFIMGITEDVPEERLKDNSLAIMKAIEDYHGGCYA